MICPLPTIFFLFFQTVTFSFLLFLRAMAFCGLVSPLIRRLVFYLFFSLVNVGPSARRREKMSDDEEEDVVFSTGACLAFQALPSLAVLFNLTYLYYKLTFELGPKAAGRPARAIRRVTNSSSFCFQLPRPRPFPSPFPPFLLCIIISNIFSYYFWNFFVVLSASLTSIPRIDFHFPSTSPDHCFP